MGRGLGKDLHRAKEQGGEAQAVGNGQDANISLNPERLARGQCKQRAWRADPQTLDYFFVIAVVLCIRENRIQFLAGQYYNK